MTRLLKSIYSLNGIDELRQADAAPTVLSANSITTIICRFIVFSMSARRAQGGQDSLNRLASLSILSDADSDLRMSPRAVEEVFNSRLALCVDMQNYVPKFVLLGSPKEVDPKLRLTYPSLDTDDDYNALPPAYRPFMGALITDWRGHRLFGLETPPDYDDLRGLDCLINIAADRLLRTESEHAYGRRQIRSWPVPAPQQGMMSATAPGEKNAKALSI